MRDGTGGHALHTAHTSFRVYYNLFHRGLLLALKYYFCAFCGKKTFLGYFPHPQIIEYFRLNIEDLRFAFGGSILKRPGKKNDGTKQLPLFDCLMSFSAIFAISAVK